MSCHGNNNELINLSRMMPDSWPIFFQQRIPRDIQSKSMPFIIKGDSVLISGPTATGKTEAALAPLYQRHVSFGRNRLGVIYIAPTKALVNDLFHRMQDYFCERPEGIVARYTGDRHEFKSPDAMFLLICTPEALDSLSLMRLNEMAYVRAFVVDEIHLLHGTPRGQQLRHVLQRVKERCNDPDDIRDNVQFIGMSATIEDIYKVSQLWLGEQSKIISSGESRNISLSILNSDVSKSKPIVFKKWLDNSNARKILAFGNTRNSTHQFAASIYDILKTSKWPVHMHMGILSTAEREKVEVAMREEKSGICVATSTLELGIDIGNIDTVVLIDPPLSISSFLQRIGRGNRRSGVCHVLCLCDNNHDEILFRALLHCAENGILDDVHEYERPSVCFQQVLSYVWYGIRHDVPVTKKSIMHRSGGDGFESIVDDMLETGALRSIGGNLIPNDDLMDSGDKRQIHTVIAGVMGRTVTDTSTGDPVAHFENRGFTSGSFFVSGKIKRLEESSEGEIFVEKYHGGKRKNYLARLPGTRGMHSFSRRLTWAIAELSEEIPSEWTFKDRRLYTWGGMAYNALLLIILRKMIPSSAMSADAFCVSGIPIGTQVDPCKVHIYAEKIFSSGQIGYKEANQFRQPTKYFLKLSKNLQKKEAINSVPIQGFLNWLKECE